VPGGGNHAPVANADRLPARHWGAAIAVLENDTDADGDRLTVARVEKMKCGRLTISKDRQTVRFVAPRSGCSRRRRGVYVASDGSAKSNRASLFIPVIPPAARAGNHGRRPAPARFSARFHMSSTRTAA
jgi:hypothetical protein